MATDTFGNTLQFNPGSASIPTAASFVPGGSLNPNPTALPTNGGYAPPKNQTLLPAPSGPAINFGILSPNYVTPNASGSVTLPSSHTAAYSAPATTQTNASEMPGGLSQYLTNNTQTGNGGTLTTDASGQPTGYTPSAGYNINTSDISSDALGTHTSMGDLNNSYGSYQDYVNALAQAQGYSPSYVAAQSGVYGAQSQGAALGVNAAQYGLNSAALNSNYYTGNNLPGDTLNYAQGATAKAQAQNTLGQAANTLAQAQNTQQQTGANIALNAQQLERTGNIAAAQTQLQSSPVGMSGQQAISQYNALQQQYPNANIPSYNPSLSPEQNQQLAQSLVAQSPAYQAGFTSTFQNAQGGTSVLNKLSLGALQENSDGTYSLVNGADKALGDANAQIVQTQANNYSNIGAALTSFGKTTQSMTQFMNQYGLNQSDIPFANQIQNSANAQLPKAGALTALKTDIANLQQDYAQFLTARGGSVAGTNQEAQDAINISNFSPALMQTVFSEMQKDGQNAQAGALSQIQAATQGLQTNQAASSIGNTQGTGGGWGSLGD